MTIVYHAVQLPLFNPTKRCFRCHQEKPLDAFDRASNKKSGYRPTCKKCRRNPEIRIVTSYTCSKCHIEKPIEEFAKCVTSNTGHRSHCKDCGYEIYGPPRRKNPEVTRHRPSKPIVLPASKICWACHQDKPLDEFARDKYRWHGHKNNCKECDLAYRQTHREEIRQYHHAHHRANRAKLLAQSKQRYLRNRERILVRCRTYNEINREAKRARDSAWQKANHLRIRQYTRRHNALKKAAQIGKVSYTRILERDGYVCHICGGAVARDQLSFDHVIPLARGGAHSEDNIKVAHKVCNSSKGAKLMSELRSRIQGRTAWHVSISS